MTRKPIHKYDNNRQLIQAVTKNGWAIVEVAPYKLRAYRTGVGYGHADSFDVFRIDSNTNRINIPSTKFIEKLVLALEQDADALLRRSRPCIYWYD